ncbi:YueI family protein [Evansella sp. AB-P1]|uniref:YueI family protein n=1 Tax=Evansella sp. AB-P1 TaxID=3037653 RepID=UPI00241E729A|nr:YueI family protein [Evansella sp. AB-P1]MDG5788740.1 YueI family protein [Evansella sp. AB-P1]
MSEKKLKQILQQGIYGKAETLPEERKLFLGTISERIYLALTNKQVLKHGLYNEAVAIMKKHKDITLYINGFLSYPAYSNYVQLANQQSIPFTIVNDGHATPIGIVLASREAIETPEDFFIKDEQFYRDMPEE